MAVAASPLVVAAADEDDDVSGLGEISPPLPFSPLVVRGRFFAASGAAVAPFLPDAAVTIDTDGWLAAKEVPCALAALAHAVQMSCAKLTSAVPHCLHLCLSRGVSPLFFLILPLPVTLGTLPDAALLPNGGGLEVCRCSDCGCCCGVGVGAA